MLLNKLKLNREKTEILLRSSLHRARTLLLHLDVCNERVLTSPKAGSIGVIFDEHLSIFPQVTAMCKPALYHLRKISVIRKYITFDRAQLLVHAVTTSKIDYCNSSLYGLPKYVRWPTGATAAHCITNTFLIKTLLPLCNWSCFPCKYKPVA